MDDQAICVAFLKNPNVYPDNPNKGLRRGFGPFNGYVQKCRNLGYNKEIDQLLNTPKSDMKSVNVLPKMVSVNKMIPIPVPRKMEGKYEKKEPLLTKKDVFTVTGNVDVDKMLFPYVGTKELSKLPINVYTKNILKDQKFWENRLEERLGLTSKNKNLDFEFITKFLDNGKDFKTNYYEAMDKGLHEVVEILLENEVVDKIEPQEILRELNTTITELSEIKNLPDDDFYNSLIADNNKLFEDEEDEKYKSEHMLDKSYFNKIVYTGDKLKIEIPNYNGTNNENEEDISYITLMSKNGLTNGKIIRAIAKAIPNEDELKEHYMNYVKNNTMTELRRLEDERVRLNERASLTNVKMIRFGNTSFPSHNPMDVPRFKAEAEDFNRKFPKAKMEQLIKNPKAYMTYMIENKEIFNGYEYGTYIYFEGLSKWDDDDYYHISLGS